ncbi:MAG: dienelactone hydrolase family protein [Methyloceanibacter sp.]
MYHAGHGFACDERASYEPESAALAWKRSSEWLEAAFSGQEPLARNLD